MARADGDIVITVGGNVSPLTDAVTKAERTLGRLNSATATADRQFRAMVGTTSEVQNRINALTGFTDRLGKSAEKSASAFQMFDQSKTAIDRLRASYDPLFAASKRYEAAVEQLDDALHLGVITQAQYAAMAQKLGASMLTTGGQVGGAGDKFGKLAPQVQNASYQVGDFFVQIASGTGAVRALAQQLPQMLGSFGMWGAIAGAAVAIGGALIQMFGGLGAQVRGFDEALGDAESTLTTLNETANMFSADGLMTLKEKYGEVNAELIRFIDLQAQAARMDALNATKEAMAALREEASSWWSGEAWSGLQDMFNLTTRQANDMALALRDAQEAASFDDQLVAVKSLSAQILAATGGIEKMTAEQFAFYQKVLESEDALRKLAAAAPESDWLSAAINQATTLAAKLWEGVRAKSALITDAGTADNKGLNAFAKDRAGVGGYGAGFNIPAVSSGGGGGGKKDDTKDRLDKLRKDFQTETEELRTLYEERNAVLAEALNKGLLTEQEYNALRLQAQADFNNKMRALDQAAMQEKLSGWSGAFGDLSSLMNTENKKLFRIGQAAAIAQAVVDGWSSAVSAWEKGMKIGGPPVAAAFTAMSLAKTGAMIASIKSASMNGGGGGSASAGSAGAAAPALPIQRVDIALTGGSADTMTTVQAVIAQLNEAAARGYRVDARLVAA